MATGSPAVLQRNLCNFVSGVSTFAERSAKAFATYNSIKDRAYANAPEDYKTQKEMWEVKYWKRHLGQYANMYVDKSLKDTVSRKDLAEYQNFRYDVLKVAHPVMGIACTGGWGLLATPFWFANDTWMPSTFSPNAETLKEWRKAQDLYRYKFAPAAIMDYRWFQEHHIPVPQNKSVAWEELMEKNDIRRDPKLCQSVGEMYEETFPFHHIRRKQARAICRAMGIATYPTFGKIWLQARIRDYWELIFNEDYMVMQPGALEALSEEELFDYAWRRFLAPVDKNLSKEEIIKRVQDYYVVLGGEKFLETTQATNIFTVITYCLGYYNDPAYLEGDISELDGDDYSHLKEWGRDAFLRRLEFENGPLRDQVEAHSAKKMEERAKIESGQA